MIFYQTKCSLLRNGTTIFIPEKEFKTHAPRWLVHGFFETRRNKVIREKGKLYDLYTDKMLFAVKWSNYFYARKANRTLYGGWSTTLWNAKEMK